MLLSVRIARIRCMCSLPIQRENSHTSGRGLNPAVPGSPFSEIASQRASLQTKCSLAPADVVIESCGACCTDGMLDMLTWQDVDRTFWQASETSPVATHIAHPTAFRNFREDYCYLFTPLSTDLSVNGFHHSFRFPCAEKPSNEKSCILLRISLARRHKLVSFLMPIPIIAAAQLVASHFAAPFGLSKLF
jgi:hypothetical protein